MGVDVRVLGAQDEAVLSRVAPDVFDHGVDPALATEFLNDPRHHIAVAVDEGLVVGFASGVHYIHPDKPAELFINEVAIAPTHHQRGLGAAVLAALLGHARTIGCRTAWVLTDRDNTAANALYGAAGGVQGAGGLGEQLRGYEFHLNSMEAP